VHPRAGRSRADHTQCGEYLNSPTSQL